MSLYVGTNYHPHDWSPERWKTDIELMKQAGVQIVRLGHLCWDSYEPEEGVYTFHWFDKVMDLFEEAEIKVFLDISMRPAPIWVHKLCPGCDIYSPGGVHEESIRRYYEDVDDPAYQHYALRFAEILVKRYKDHPALFAFGLCNEQGTGKMSFSPYAKKRFQNWLKKKYGTIEHLNHAWSTQRWSRRLTSFDDVVLPENDFTKGSPEAWLDMRRFYSDGIAHFIIRLRQVVKKQAPNIPVAGNLFSGAEKLGFDLLRYCDHFEAYPSTGYYPMYNVEDDLFHYFMIGNREYVNETNKPLWFLEFQTGRDGIFCGPKGYLHMLMMLMLLYRGQVFLGWTWRSMLGGEEQYHHGILGHDGYPTPNYYELAEVAKDMRKLSSYAFPYLPSPEIAVAISHESWWVAQYQSGQFRQNYKKSAILVQRALYDLQREYNVVNLRNLKGHYKLLIIPGHILIDPAVSNTIRDFISEGGTAIMTGYSGTVNENGQVYDIPHPGSLSDVFGIRVAGFYRTDMPGFFSENSSRTIYNGKERELLTITGMDSSVNVSIDYYEDLECHSATPLAFYQEKELPAITINSYGKGNAIYVGSEVNSDLLKWLINHLAPILQLEQPLMVPHGIQARKIASNQYFYVNTTNHQISFALPTHGKGILSDQIWERNLTLPPYGAELILAD